MACALYIILPRENKWIILADGKDYGPYHGQGDALDAAIEAAKLAEIEGFDASVKILDTNRQFITAWPGAKNDQLPQPIPKRGTGENTKRDCPQWLVQSDVNVTYTMIR